MNESEPGRLAAGQEPLVERAGLLAEYDGLDAEWNELDELCSQAKSELASILSNPQPTSLEGLHAKLQGYRTRQRELLDQQVAIEDLLFNSER